MSNRICKTCKKEKDIILFRYHSSYGYFSRECIECENKKRKEKYKIKYPNGKISKERKYRKKKCSGCGIEKDIRVENFGIRSKSNKRTIYHKLCAICLEKWRIEQKEKKILKYRERDDGSYKKCCICGERKNKALEFHYDSKRNFYSYCCRKCDSNRKINRIKSYTKEEKEFCKNKEKGLRGKRRHVDLLPVYRKFDRDRALDNNLSPHFTKIMLGSLCTYCGFPSTGLDRIDNSKGHTEENCVPCCYECNTARMNNFSFEEMKTIGKAIREVKLSRIDAEGF